MGGRWKGASMKSFVQIIQQTPFWSNSAPISKQYVDVVLNDLHGLRGQFLWFMKSRNHHQHIRALASSAPYSSRFHSSASTKGSSLSLNSSRLMSSVATSAIPGVLGGMSTLGTT
jgi:hypothetical protein